MDPMLLRYLESILNIFLAITESELERSTFVDESVEEAESYALIRFYDGSRLHVGLTVDELDGFPMRREYAFHYMTSGDTTIFRYDNIRHHLGLPHFSHHKREGVNERVVGCPQPSASMIRTEIAAHLKRLN